MTHRGFIAEYSPKDPGYFCVLPWLQTNEYLGHITGMALFRFCEDVQKNLFSVSWKAETKKYCYKNWSCYKKLV